MTITIETRWYRATLTDGPDGVTAVVWSRLSRADGMYRLNDTWTFDAPFHVVCDRVHDLLTKLSRSGPPQVKADRRLVSTATLSVAGAFGSRL